ncbi:MAG TPA: hypothetical protein VIF34_07330 [Methylocystis sp.]
MNGHYQSGDRPRNAPMRAFDGRLSREARRYALKAADAMRSAKKISAASFIMLEKLILKTGSDGVCRIGNAWLMKVMGQCIRSVYNHIRELVDAGIIRFEPRRRGVERTISIVQPAQAAEPATVADPQRPAEPRADRPAYGFSQRRGIQPQTETPASRPAPAETFIPREDPIYGALTARLARFSNRLIDRGAPGMNFLPAWITAERVALADGG